MSRDWPSLESMFKYEPLNLNRPAFRLLRLKSARNSQTIIECEIVLAYIDVDDVPIYEAISYTWGATTSPRKIRLNGFDFFVRFNLWSVLRDVRRQDEDRLVWVDAICINQDDVRERGHQVQQMRHVYERAARVIFWLGQLTDPSIDILMDLLAELQGRTCGVSWLLTDPRWRNQWEQIPKASLDNLRSAFQELLERPWFRRVWILQEVANARAGLVHCGHKSVSAMTFAVCPSLLEVEPNKHCQAVLDVMPGPSRSGSWWEQDRRLHTLLRKFSETEATRDHDRIFALFGLCPEANAQITVDYNKPMPQLLRETVSYILKDNPSPYDIEALRCFEYDSTKVFLEDIDVLHSRILEQLLQLEPIHIVNAFHLRFQDQLAITPELCVAALTRKELGDTFVLSILHRNPRALQVEDRQGRTPLTVATEFENVVLMRALVENGADCRDLKGFLPLYKASELGNVGIVQLLLNRGASYEITAADLKNPPLATVCVKERTAMQKQLSNCDKLSNLNWSLDVALNLGHETVAQLLLDHGATAPDSAYLWAIKKEVEAIDRLILDGDAAAMDQALISACKAGQQAIVWRLLDRGAPATGEALKAACEGGQEAIARLLLDRGAPAADEALREASMFGRNAIVRLLLGFGLDLEGSDDTGRTALSFASQYGHVDVARTLLDAGADCNSRDTNGMTPLVWAQVFGWNIEKVVQLLRSRGATDDGLPFLGGRRRYRWNWFSSEC